MSTTQRALISATDLSKSFPEVGEVVCKANLEIFPGECFALLGPNGAGKTTICEMFEGLQEPTSGKIEVLGMDYATDRRKILQRIGVQLQSTKLYGRFTVEETLCLFASFYEHSLPIQEVLELVDLVDQKNLAIRKLSGGQQQRVYLACCLLNDPEVVFLDEPTTGLDPQARRELWRAVDGLKTRGKGVFLTTHYMDEAHALADRVAIIDKGHIVATGSPDELTTKYSEGHTLSFSLPTATTFALDQLQERLPWLKESLNGSSGATLIRTKLSNAHSQVPELLEQTSQLGLDLRSFSVQQSSLEDVFIALTGKRIHADA